MAPLKNEAFHDSSNLGPRESHNMRDGGVFSVYASTQIAAPAAAVFDALLAIEHWPTWNSFVPEVKVTKHPRSHTKNLRMEAGTFMTFTVQMTASHRTTSKEVCTHVGQLKTWQDHPGHAVTHIRWSLDNANSFLPGFIMRAERTNEIEELQDGTTVYRTWETFGGWAAGTVRKKHGQALQERFADWARDLKGFVEKEKGPLSQTPDPPSTGSCQWQKRETTERPNIKRLSCQTLCLGIRGSHSSTKNLGPEKECWLELTSDVHVLTYGRKDKILYSRPDHKCRQKMANLQKVSWNSVLLSPSL
nr:hypothetical protein CFP56_30736 [Quercus suber]